MSPRVILYGKSSAPASPGDVVDEATVRALGESLGLNDPLPVQYLRWLGGDFFTGDMGLSHISRTPVVDQVLPALGITLSLVFVALALQCWCRCPWGGLLRL